MRLHVSVQESVESFSSSADGGPMTLPRFEVLSEYIRFRYTKREQSKNVQSDRPILILVNQLA